MTDNLPHALILSGGKATRMGGVDKGLLEWQGLPLVEHVARNLQKQVGSLHVSCNRNEDRYAEILEKYPAAFQSTIIPSCIADKKWKNRGPLGGIHEFLSLFEFMRTRCADTVNTQVFICCCDTPLLPGNIIELLQEKMDTGNCDAVFPRSGESRFWLNLMLDSQKGLSALEQLEREAVNDRSFSVENWLGYLNCSTITVQADRQYLNINTPADMNHLLSG